MLKLIKLVSECTYGWWYSSIFLLRVCIVLCLVVNWWTQFCSPFRLGKSENLYRSHTVTFLILNITSFLKDFMHFRKQYQRRSSKSNARLYFSPSTSCTQLLPVRRLLWWTSIWNSHYNGYCFTVENRKFGTLIG